MRKKEKGEIPMEMPGYMLVSWLQTTLSESVGFSSPGNRILFRPNSAMSVRKSGRIDLRLCNQG